MNGTKTAVPAVERNKRVFVPMRGVFEKLGASVEYAPPGTVAAKKNGASLAQLTMGSRTALVHGSARQLDAPPFKSASRIFVPLRLISEAAGAKVAYVAAPRSIRITGGPAVAAAQPATQRHGIPWWIWLLLALLLLFLLLRFLRRPAHDGVVTTRSSSDPTIGTSGRT
ncbi:MAG: copper amine oxidase N-terminal domain-containing protein [Candidatus Eremiobacteraeota bacterium]|nr:copper amine oxidase N-terminal domain-containing protein [Candidatus Eremiobacteraeota bacterium]